MHKIPQIRPAKQWTETYILGQKHAICTSNIIFILACLINFKPHHYWLQHYLACSFLDLSKTQKLGNSYTYLTMQETSRNQLDNGLKINARALIFLHLLPSSTFSSFFFFLAQLNTWYNFSLNSLSFCLSWPKMPLFKGELFSIFIHPNSSSQFAPYLKPYLINANHNFYYSCHTPCLPKIHFITLFLLDVAG